MSRDSRITDGDHIWGCMSSAVDLVVLALATSRTRPLLCMDGMSLARQF